MSVFCVNRKSREFLDLASKHNVDHKILETIVNGFYKEQGSMDVFPTDAYIKEKLGYVQYAEESQPVRELWALKYGFPQEFQIQEELEKAKKEALLYFPPAALHWHTTESGSHLLIVERPVEPSKLTEFISEKEQLDWIQQYQSQLVDRYLSLNGNRYDPDRVRDLLAPLGYDKENLNVFYKAGKALNSLILDAMTQKLSQSDNKTVSILTGTPGSGKTFATQNRKQSLDSRGMVLDAPFHTIESLQRVIDRAREAGVKDEDIEVIAVYNDLATTYKNSVARGKQQGRWLPLQYFLTSFMKNQGKIKALADNNPNVKIVIIDNSQNQSKEVTLEEAFNWDYTINAEQFEELKNSIKDDTEISEERKEELLRGVNLGELAEVPARGQAPHRGTAPGEVQRAQSGLGLSPKADIAAGEPSMQQETLSEPQMTATSTTEQQDKVTEVLDEYDRITQQIGNLLEGKIAGTEAFGDKFSISASEVRHVSEQVANLMSDLITRVQTEEGAVEELFPMSKPKESLVGKPRKDIVKALDINNFVAKAKETFKGAKRNDLIAMCQMGLILDNWDAIMYLAADVFAANEGFGITRDYENKKFSTTETPNIGWDNFNEYQNAEDIQEKEGDEQEHWQVEARTIDVLNSMSEIVRAAIHSCYLLDKDGKPVISKWGIKERVNPRKAVTNIMRWTQGSLALENMVKGLRNHLGKAPWLEQIITRLEDTSGNEADFQSQFFSVFDKHFQTYSIVQKENGQYISKVINTGTVMKEAMGSLAGQFRTGTHPLFASRGINTEYLNTLRGYAETIKNASLHSRNDEPLSGEEVEKAVAAITAASKVLGYMVTEELVSELINHDNLEKFQSLTTIIDKLDKVVAKGSEYYKSYNPFDYFGENSISRVMRVFLSPITDSLEDDATSAFYESGKMYQSYVTPSYLTKLIQKFKTDDPEKFEKFLEEQYGFSKFFKNPDGTWRTPWLQDFMDDARAQEVFDHKVELAFNKHNYMRSMSDAEYALSLISEYFSTDTGEADEYMPAWFRVPILSNKPSSEFIKFFSYRGDRYKGKIVDGMYDIFMQELSLIQTVLMRNKIKGDPSFIKDFDKNGRRFNYLTFLNSYLEDTAIAKEGRTLLEGEQNNADLAKLLQDKTQGRKELSAAEETRLMNLVKDAIHNHMDRKANEILDNWEKDGIIEAATNIQGIFTILEEDANKARRQLKNAKTQEEKQKAEDKWQSLVDFMVRKNLENFIWNDTFAVMNIMELTITSPAFYKDAEALQKRMAQLHAPGVRANVRATDYRGKRVSDGKYRTIILKDFDNFKSNVIANIAEVFDRRIAAAPKEQKQGLRALKESLVGEDGKYTKINVADAQGYSSPSSYRKKAFLFGRWSKQAEKIYNSLKEGKFTYTDLETAFQPLKPFVFSHLDKDISAGESPISHLPVPFQAKNAEYLLIMADAILQGAEKEGIKTSRPNLLRAIFRVMEDSEAINPTKGIDTVQFESAIKSGLQGAMDIHQFLDQEAAIGEEAAYNHMMDRIYKEAQDDNGTRVYKDYNTTTFVHEAPYEDYCLQQEVPEHFKDHEQSHGSQIRMITPSDLDLYKNPNVDHNDPDNQVFYEFTDYDRDGNKITRKVKADEFRKEYENTIAENIKESLNELSRELHLDSENKKERNIALSKILQREIFSSPRYGVDLALACSVDKKTGEFKIPKGDPIQAKRIEQLINSIIKNRVNKQTIAGGPIVQVSNFGTSKQLHIRFNSKAGGLLKTREEYEQNPQKKELSQTDKFNARYGKKPVSDTMSYEEYVKENQAGIAYFEVYLPIWSKELVDKFSNPDGSINVEAIEATDPELLKMVSYRIPTEDKYSCAPMKVVGFMPREAGEAIMLPQELTEIDDSDFDVDKRYVMRKELKIVPRDKAEVRQKLFEKTLEGYRKAHNGKENKKLVDEQVREFLDNPEKMKTADALMQSLYAEYQKIAWTTKPPTEGRTYRNNKIVDMTLGILTNEMTADKILNPGGFDPLKKMGYMITAYKTGKYTWQELEAMSIDDLADACYVDKDLNFVDAQIQFYSQNSAAASLIGVFAVNKVAHATLEGNGIFLDVEDVCGKEFIIGDVTSEDRMEIDPKYDNEGNLIGKSLGMGVSASADAAKTPVLNLMNINMSTVGVFSTLLRLGMSLREATLFMSQDIIGRILKKFNQENLNNYVTLDSIMNEYFTTYERQHGIDENSTIHTEPITREELIEGVTFKEHASTDYKVLKAFQKLRALTEHMRKITFATRFNSMSSAVGPLIIDNLITEHKVEQFTGKYNPDGTKFFVNEKGTRYNVDITNVFSDHPILEQFHRTVGVAERLFSDMPAGSTGFRNILKAFPQVLLDNTSLIERIYSDKKLLDSLSNFYQSYLLVQSGVVDARNTEKYINEIPVIFTRNKYKEKYADNPLIQAINLKTERKSGRVFLEIPLTGKDETYKEELRSGWIELHKKDPGLSQMLFNYCFFRGGIGFSPKTFMALVPTYVKERLSTKQDDGSVATYLDTYRNFPSVNPELVIDQWVRNNWDNTKLAPWKTVEKAKQFTDSLVADTAEGIAELGREPFIKTNVNGKVTLWKMAVNTKEYIEYKRTAPLGSNGTFLEMSKEHIGVKKQEVTSPVENNDIAELEQASPAETQESEPAATVPVKLSEEAKVTEAMASLIMKYRNTQTDSHISSQEAKRLLDRVLENPKKYKGFIENLAKTQNLDIDEQKALERFKKLC